MNNEIINITFVGSARKNASKMHNIPIRAGVDGGRVLMAAGVDGGRQSGRRNAADWRIRQVS